MNWNEFKAENSKLVVDKVEQELRALGADELVFLKHSSSQEVLGPFEKGELKSALPEEDEFLSELELRAGGTDGPTNEEEWTPLTANPFFQRRRPQLMSAGALESLDDNTFYLLREGQKFGPLSLEEIRSLAVEHEILATDLISIDGGESFGKLYEWEEFDRRTMAQGELPPRPNEDFLTLGNIEVLKGFKQNTQNKDEAEAMANLAFVGNNRGAKVIAWNPEINTGKARREPKKEGVRESISAESNQTMSAYFYATVFAVSVIGILYMGLTWQSPQESMQAVRAPASATEAPELALEVAPESAGPRPITLTPIEKIPSAQVEEVRELTQQKIRPLKKSTRSFRGSNSFKKALSDNPLLEEEGYQYDDGQGAMEQDPVRAHISKETFDPELSPTEEMLADEPYPEELSPEGIVSPRPLRRPASSDASWVDDASAPLEDDFYQGSSEYEDEGF